MNKRIIHTDICLLILLIAMLLGGCAKVTQDPVVCTGTAPPRPQVSDVVVPQGSSRTIRPNNTLPYNARVTWRGPNGFLAYGQELFIDFASSSYYNYGIYTVTATVDGCSSAADSFRVTDTYVIQSGNPPCTISLGSYNKMMTSSGSTFTFNTGSSYYSSCNGNSLYRIVAYTSSSYTIHVFTQDPPLQDHYYDLSSSCYMYTGQAHIEITTNNETYISSSGNVYFNQIGGNSFVTLCGANFTRTNSGIVTITGNVMYN